MSIVSAVQQYKFAKFVIPFPGKMQKSNISKTNQALCLCINKGYFEASNPALMQSILNDLQSVSAKVLCVGSLDTVSTSSGIMYRQRVFCKSFRVLLDVCKINGATIVLGDDFYITINSILNCLSECAYMEHYAHKQGELIDDWLTHCLIIHIHSLLLGMGMYSQYGNKVEEILRGRVGYCDRAPFLLAEFNRDDKKSSIFMELDNTDRRLFTTDAGELYANLYGFTTANVQKDLKEGVFHDTK